MPIRGNLALGLAIPVTRRARLTVERDLVKRRYRCRDESTHREGCGCGVPVGSLDRGLLLPAGARTLHSKILDGAQQFIRDYAKQGYQSLTDPESFVVWGPYQCRGFGMRANTPQIAHLSMEGEDQFPDSADFIIQGDFLATQGRIAT